VCTIIVIKGVRAMLIRMNSACISIENYSSLSRKEYLDLLLCFVNVNEELLIGMFECNISEAFEPEQQNYILENIIFKNNIWVFPWKPFQDDISIVWMKPKNNEELEKIISVAGFCIDFVVVNETKLLDDISYVLYPTKFELDTGVKRMLYAIDKRGNTFSDNILPKIIELFPDTVYIFDDDLKANIYE
jgi:hypothetical protein